MRMNIDEAGGYASAACIDHLNSGACFYTLPHRDDPIAAYKHIRVDRRCTKTVQYRTTLDQKLTHGFPPGACRTPGGHHEGKSARWPFPSPPLQIITSAIEGA